MNVTAFLTWETPPADSERKITRTEIAETLTSRPNAWAIVARPDRRDRADALVKRITVGSEYGSNFEACAVKIGGEFRVYARFVR